jgi:hypothetical protein
MTEELDGMGNPKPNFRWSFSQWESYNQCPQKWNFASRMKLPRQPPGPAAARGLEIHDSVEKYILGADASELHSAVHKKYIPVFDALRNHPNGERYTEKKMAFDSEWFLTAPTSKFAACIAVLDAVRVGGDRYGENVDEDLGVVRIYEWKSGKPKDTHVDQRRLYAMFGWRAWIASRVEATTFYLEDTSPPQKLVMKDQGGYNRMRVLWEGRIHEMRTNEICAPRPGFYCRFCDFAKSKGGPCQFGS